MTWSEYDRQSKPVFSTKDLNAEQIWSDFLDIEQTINDQWLKLTPYPSSEWLLRDYKDGYSEYNVSCYLSDTQSPESKATILHLSDLHYGSKNDSDVDAKANLGIDYDTYIERLKNYLKMIEDRQIDYVIVTGDFSHQGGKEGFDLFKSVVKDFQKEGRFPNDDHIICTPGNHDIFEGKFEHFEKNIASNYITPVSSDGDTSSDYHVTDPQQYIGNTQSPFTLDKDNKLLIYVFNSSYASQSVKITIYRSEETGSETKSIEKVDPGHISANELDAFYSNMRHIKKNLVQDDNFDEYTKIAVLHHHTSSISNNTEVKEFESLINAGEFKKCLMQWDFNLILHGHKHWAEAFWDSAVAGGGAFLTVSGGQICGQNDIHKGFFLIDIYKYKDLAEVRYYQLKSIPIQPISESFQVPRNRNKIGVYEDVINLKNIYRTSTKSMMSFYDKNEHGWTHKLVNKYNRKEHVSLIASAYGLKIMWLLNAHEREFLESKNEILDEILKKKNLIICGVLVIQNRDRAGRGSMLGS